MTEINIDEIEKAYMEFKGWLRLDRGHTTKIMINKRSGDVWTDIFLNGNWKVYQDEDIVSLCEYLEPCEDITVENLYKCAQKLVKETSN